MVGLRAPFGVEGGVEQSVGALAPRLAARGVALTVYCRRRYNTRGPGMIEGARLVDGDTLYSKHAEAAVHTLLCAPRAAIDHDIVHLHAAGPALFSLLPRLAGRKVVVTIHGLDWQRDKWGPVARQALRLGALCAGRLPHRLVCVGQHLADWFAAHLGVQAVVIPNGVDPIAPVPLTASGVEGLEAGRYLLYLGRLVPEKGLDRLFSAYAAAKIGLPLVVVGGDTHAEAWARGLRSRAPAGVRLVGPRHGPARDALLGHARALVLPSEVEGFPLVPLEAASAGRPLLLSDIPAHREQLGAAAGRAGWLVAPEGWVGALRAVEAATPAALQAAGETARVEVAGRWGWDRAAQRLVDEVYAPLLGRSPALAGAGAP